jgi:hypothetical protein
LDPVGDAVAFPKSIEFWKDRRIIRDCIDIPPHNAPSPHRPRLVYGYQDFTCAGEDCRRAPHGVALVAPTVQAERWHQRRCGHQARLPRPLHERHSDRSRPALAHTEQRLGLFFLPSLRRPAGRLVARPPTAPPLPICGLCRDTHNMHLPTSTADLRALPAVLVVKCILCVSPSWVKKVLASKDNLGLYPHLACASAWCRYRYRHSIVLVRLYSYNVVDVLTQAVEQNRNKVACL